MTELSTKMKKFVAEVMPAVVGTRRRNGSVQMNPIWYEYSDGYFWLNSWRTSDGCAMLSAMAMSPCSCLTLMTSVAGHKCRVNW